MRILTRVTGRGPSRLVVACVAELMGVFVAAERAAYSHETDAVPRGPDGMWAGDWTWDPIVITLLICASVLYTRGLARMWRRAGRGRGIRVGQGVCFASGLLVLGLALLSPLDGSSDLLFSAHMTQHELLMLVAAPLLVLGRPLAPMLGGLPVGARHHLLAALHAPSLTRAARRATGPIFVWILNAGVLWLWHVPFLYEAALASEGVHWVQHASFLGAAGLFWWTLVEGRYGRAGYGIAALFVFATALQSSVLAVLLTLSPDAWYPTHRLRLSGQGGGLSAVEDQQIAGLILWVPAGILLALMALALFATWLGEVERRMQRREAVATQTGRHVSPAGGMSRPPT